MDSSYLSAFAGLAGAMIGGLTSFGSTWISQRAQLDEKHSMSALKKRETLYVEFTNEASRLYADALSHERDDVADLVHLYAIASHIRMISSSAVIRAAEAVIDAIVDAYLGPNRTLSDLKTFAAAGGLDPLNAFSRMSRAELAAYRR